MYGRNIFLVSKRVQCFQQAIYFKRLNSLQVSPTYKKPQPSFHYNTLTVFNTHTHNTFPLNFTRFTSFLLVSNDLDFGYFSNKSVKIGINFYGSFCNLDAFRLIRDRKGSLNTI